MTVKNYLGENLIFVISQPRTGSTLLQRTLGNHPDIHTLSEPWLLLHPLYALREEGIWTEYNARIAYNARQNFIQSLPQGDENYFEGLRRMYGYLYERGLAGTGKEYFLDKTPRYYQIIPQIHRIFPRAQFITLLRNPLAVLCSILRTWVRGGWFLLHKYKSDLLRAPALLLEGISLLDESCVVVHYERFVSNPRSRMNRLCASLGLDFVPDMIEYGKSGASHWQHGDRVGVRRHTKPDPECAEKWMQDIENPQVWRLAEDYLEHLGADTVVQMGYSYDELRHTLDSHRPNPIRLHFTYPLDLLLNTLNWTEQCYFWEHNVDRLMKSVAKRGIRETVHHASQEIAEVMPRSDGQTRRGK